MGEPEDSREQDVEGAPRPEDEPTPPPEERPSTPAEQRRRPARVRLTSLAGTVSALLLGLCFFLDWVRVDASVAAHFRAGIENALEKKDATSPVDDDFEALAAILESEGALTGMDLIYWVRTAGAWGRDPESTRGGGDDAQTQRALVLARLLLYAMLFTGFLLAAYFLFHGFRRAATPVLILCVLVGASAVVLAGGMNYAHHLVRDALGADAAGVQPGPGPAVLLAGGAGLVLAGTFGVSLRNFYRVYVGVGVTAGALYLLALRYMQAGSLT